MKQANEAEKGKADTTITKKEKRFSVLENEGMKKLVAQSKINDNKSAISQLKNDMM